MEEQQQGHPPQVFEIPAGTRYVLVPPRQLSAYEAEKIMDLLSEAADPRVLTFGEPGWTVHVVPEVAV